MTGNEPKYSDPRRLFADPNHAETVVPRVTSVDEAVMTWLANYLNRPRTTIGVLILKEVPSDFCRRFPIAKVNILELSNAQPASNPFLLAENALVNTVHWVSRGLLQNGTVKAAKHLVIRVHELTTTQVLMDLNCLKLELIFDILPYDFLLDFCRKIMQHGRPLGYFCSLPTYGNMDLITLDWIGQQLGARKTTILERKCITLGFVTDSEVEMNLRTNPEQPSTLWIEVSKEGTAMDR